MEKFRSLVVGLDLICQQLVLNAPAKAEATLLVGWLTVPKYKKKNLEGKNTDFEKDQNPFATYWWVS